MADFLIVGCGYVGSRLAAALTGQVVALVRNDAAAGRLARQGIGAVACDLDQLSPGRSPPVACGGASVFYLAPPPGEGPTDPRLRRWLDTLDSRALPRRLLYMSTTGVYGDGRVDEDTPPVAYSDRARARLDAELAVREWCEARGVGWTILRVPGIYGPGRLPLERLRRGEPAIAAAEAGPGNRIHVDDLVRTCVAAAASQVAANRLYNVGDGNHASATEYFRAVARLAGLPPPVELPRAEARRQMSAPAWSFLGQSREVDTSRMERELRPGIRYRDLVAGIRASLGSEGSPR